MTMSEEESSRRDFSGVGEGTEQGPKSTRRFQPRSKGVVVVIDLRSPERDAKKRSAVIAFCEFKSPSGRKYVLCTKGGASPLWTIKTPARGEKEDDSKTQASSNTSHVSSKIGEDRLSVDNLRTMRKGKGKTAGSEDQKTMDKNWASEHGLADIVRVAMVEL